MDAEEEKESARERVCVCVWLCEKEKEKERLTWRENLGVENELSGSAYQLIKTTRKLNHADHMDMQPQIGPSNLQPQQPGPAPSPFDFDSFMRRSGGNTTTLLSTIQMHTCRLDQLLYIVNSVVHYM